MRWHITVFLLMPDHLHAVLSFARDKSMSELIRGWKRFNTRANRVMWQEGYFDHRLRADERGTQLSAKLNYIGQNPVAAGLCARAEDWPWIIDPFACQDGSSCPKVDGSACLGDLAISRRASSKAFRHRSASGGELARVSREFPP